jgi:hypothetical protein
MAIAPNTTFFTGYTLTATQLNAFPRGIMAFTTATSSDTTITSEEVQIAGSLFNAVANRYYKITYYEPALYHGSQATATARIRLTNLAGAVQQSSLSFAYTTSEETTCVAITTLTAGPTQFVGTLQSSSGNIQATRSATQYAFLLVEDIGPA